MPQEVLPSFWVPHPVRRGETLSAIAKRYRYSNPGPILVFNCDHLPNAVAHQGSPRRFSDQWIKSRSKKNRLHHALGVRGAIDPRSTPAYAPLQSNQVNSMAILWDHAGWQHGDVLTIVKAYPNRIIDNAKKRIDRIDRQIRWANQARTRSFYRHVVKDSAA